MTHICVNKLTIIGSDNGLSPGRHQAIIWTNAGILLIRILGTNFTEILIKNWYIFIEENAFENVVCEMASICLGLNVLTQVSAVDNAHYSHLFAYPLNWKENTNKQSPQCPKSA